MCMLYPLMLVRLFIVCNIEICLMNLSITKKKIQVGWGNAMPQQFKVYNGVKQSVVLSPILFAVYIDRLLGRLKESRIGCNMSNSYVGGMVYADDIKLLCPSLNGMQQMVDMYVDYADEYNIIFNGSKSCMFLFKGKCGTN